jgi:putative colanic acid biosynthesis glycosyltransferase
VIRFLVVTVARDDRDGFARTRDSLAAQTHRARDWAVAEGGSADGTADLVHAARRDAAWLRTGPDGGPYDGMNRAVAGAGTDADYVVFMNAGDAFAAPDTLERVAEAAEAAGRPGLLYGDSLVEERPGAWRLRRARRHGTHALGMFARHQAMYFRRDLLPDAPYGAAYAIAADYALALDVLDAGAGALRLRRTLCRFAGGGLSERFAAAGRREQAEIRSRRGDLPEVALAAIAAAQSARWTLRRLCLACAPAVASPAPDSADPGA